MDWLKGSWMQTYTGKRFYPFDPQASSIDIVDIAHALAMTCRYGGHCKQFYSVAQHSVLVASKAPVEKALRALMHDAPEAYTGDLVRPIKKHPEMGAFTWVEQIVERAICAKFDLPFPIMDAEIKRLDNRILIDERDQVVVPTDDDWQFSEHEPLGVTIGIWAPEIARQRFLNAFEEYSKWDRKIQQALTHGRAA